VSASTIDRCTQQICGTIGILEDIRDDVLGGIYAQVRDAMSTDRQYVYESIIYWQSKGDDLATIATNLETEVVVLVDIIDEFSEAD
jgi:hypothetical protein